MPNEEQPERSVGAMPGPARALSVSTDGIINRTTMRPADWNSGENNNNFYPDPGELAWERAKAMEAENQTETPNPAEAEPNGSAAVQQSPMSKRGRGRPKKSVSNASARTAGSDNLRVPDVSRRRDPDPDQLSAVRQSGTHQGREATRKPRDLTKAAEPDRSALEADRNQAMLGFMTFERYIQDAPLKDAFIIFNDFSKRIIDAGNALEARRQLEKQGENACSFCDHVFTFRGTDIFKARRAFDLPDGRVQVVMACSKGKCLDEFDTYVQDMSMRSRETLH
jgi:hypothetical protein